MNELAIRTTGLTKRFGGFVAVNGFSVEPGVPFVRIIPLAG